MRQPPIRVTPTFREGGGASPRTPVTRTRSAPSSVSRTVVQAGGHVRAEIAHALGLVEELGGDGAGGDGSARAGVFGDDRRAVLGDLREREAGAADVVPG
ncbi:hypothetical protein Snoj_83500 [Streptomyces nojiriensis]|uniref:Uncharacterized protein n=1 Tax=Streptomyces nojiriensis TaxID=66374 RepID=A0ABQ3T2M5_9ACTN|nr:hypothetical protein Snoj_83500 [Streptomyces nojiriensis]